MCQEQKEEGLQMSIWRPFIPYFSRFRFGAIEMRPASGGTVVPSGSGEVQYCKQVDVVTGTATKTKVWRCSPTVAEAVAEPQENFTEYESLPPGALQL